MKNKAGLFWQTFDKYHSAWTNKNKQMIINNYIIHLLEPCNKHRMGLRKQIKKINKFTWILHIFIFRYIHYKYKNKSYCCRKFAVWKSVKELQRIWSKLFDIRFSKNVHHVSCNYTFHQMKAHKTCFVFNYLFLNFATRLMNIHNVTVHECGKTKH